MQSSTAASFFRLSARVVKFIRAGLSALVTLMMIGVAQPASVRAAAPATPLVLAPKTAAQPLATKVVYSPVKAPQAALGDVCFAEYTGDNTTDFSSADASAVQQAVDAAAVNGTVKVAGACAGVQTRAGTTQTVVITKALTLAGGFTATNWSTSDPIANPTTLDAQTNGRVISATAGVTISGLIVQNGTAAGGSGGGGWFGNSAIITTTTFTSNTANADGGGAYFNNTVTLQGSRFQQNIAGSDRKGGGAYFATAANVSGTQFVSNTFSTISAGSTCGSSGACGGGAYIASNSTAFTNTAFSGNSASVGGGIYAISIMVITGASFISNSASLDGGGLMLLAGMASINNSAFTNNSAVGGSGGAAYFGASINGTSGITSSTFIGNSASVSGGGVLINTPASTTNRVVNSLFARNRIDSTTNGSAIHATGNAGRLDIIFSTVVSPSQVTGAAIYAATSGLTYITNTIITSHTVGIGGFAGGVNQSYNLFSGVTTPTLGAMNSSGGNLFGEAAFVNPALDNYHILSTSLAADGGNNVGITTDIDGDARPRGDAVDIGYDETDPPAPRCFATPDNGTTVFSSTTSSAAQQAVDAAATNGTVKVAGMCAGVQQRSAVLQAVFISKTLTLLGGYTAPNWATSDSGNPTILDARNAGRALYANAALTTSNFILQKGNGSNGAGGGGYFGSPSVLTGMTFISNSAANQGGGAAFNAPVVITGGQFISNTSTSSGGGAWFNTSATISGTSFVSNTGNQSGGAYFQSVATLTNTRFVSNTGSYYAGGATFQNIATLVNAVFISNTTIYEYGGGAQFNGVTNVITGSTFIANRAAYQFGGGGGGIATLAGQIRIFNSVFARNSAATGNGAAMYFNAGPNYIAHTTIASPTLAAGNAIYSTGAIVISNTIVTSHTTGIVGSTNSSYNLFSGNTSNGVAIGTGSVTGDPRFLNPALDDYHIITGSAAINKGANAGILIDRDGLSRPKGAGFDMGAYEFNNNSPVANAGAPQPVTISTLVTLTGGLSYDPDGEALTFGWTQQSGTPVTLDNASAISPTFTAPGITGTLVFQLIVTDTINQPSAPALVTITVNLPAACYATPNDGTTVFGSADASAVQQAVDAAPTNGTVKVAGVCAGVQTRAGTTQTVIITKALSLMGGFTTTAWSTYNPAGNPTTLDALAQGRVVSASVAATLMGFTATNGYLASQSPLDGGGIYAGSALTLTDMNVVSNTVINLGVNGNDKRGGGAFIAGAALVTNSSFISNTANSDGVVDNRGGGGLWVGGTASVTGSTFISNVTYVNGAGAYFDSAATLVNSTFRNNKTTHFSVGSGAGAAFNITSTVIGSTFDGNFVNNGGAGALFLSGAVITDSIFINNIADGAGGGIFVTGGASITGSTFFSNSAYSYGGGAYLAGATVVTGTTFSRNFANVNNGGGAYFNSLATLNNTQFISNTAQKDGGGAYVNGVSSLAGTSFISNALTGSYNGGGAFFNTLTVITGSTFINNISAGGGGGGAFNAGSTLTNTTFTNNRARTQGGGGVFAPGQVLEGVSFTGNNVTNGSGGGAHFVIGAAMTHTTFTSNTAAFNGGGALFLAAAALSGDATFISNTAANNGGGAYFNNTVAVSGNFTFISNTATSSGGGAFFNAAANLSDLTFAGNRVSSGNGGGVAFNAPLNTTSAITNITFISNGASGNGGAVHNNASTLQVSATQFVSNSANNAGGLYNSSGKVTLDASTFTSNTTTGAGNGGAVFNSSGEITITNGSLFRANTTASAGGALLNSAGTMRVFSSTVVSNTAATGGGSFYNQTGGQLIIDNSDIAFNQAGLGGGIGILGATSGLTITNSRLFSNTGSSDGGALYQQNGSSRISSSCIVGNSSTAVRYVGGTAPITATGNWWGSASGPAGVGTGVGDSVSSNVDFSSFLTSAPSGCPSVAAPNVAISKVVTPASGLAGSTITYTLRYSNTGAGAAGGVVISDSVPASVTINSVSSSGATITQTSGAPNFAWQVSNLAVNAGGIITLSGVVSSAAVAGDVIANSAIITASDDASDANNSAPANFTVTAPAVCFATPNDGSTVFSSANANAVQQAVDAAVVNSTVKVAGVCAGVQTRGGTTQTVIVTQALTLAGGFTVTDWSTSDPIANPTVLDALTQGRVISATAAMTVSDIIIQRGSTSGNGGGASFLSSAVLTGMTFLSNTAAGNGGGAYARGAVTLNGGRFENNTSTSDYGGGLYANSTLALTGTVFISNTAYYGGGGAYAVDAATLDNATLTDNRSAGSGGGLYAANTLALTGTRFLSNTASGASASDGGGGVFVAGIATLTNTSFISNTANVGGGGAFFAVTATLTSNTFAGNTVNRGTNTNGLGGGAYFFRAATLTANTFISNSAVNAGGGAFFERDASLAGNTFAGNASNFGGGGFFGVNTTLTGTIFTANVARTIGGGAYFGASVALTSTTFTANTAGFGGGAYFAGVTAASLVNGLFARNTASSTLGAALYVANVSPLNIVHTTIASPTVAGGSAIYINTGTVNITNTLIASHTLGIENAGGTVNENYNLFSGVSTPTSGTVVSGGNSITGSAGFVDAANDNYRLSPASAAINKAMNAGITTDFGGNARPFDAGFDIGAFEAQAVNQPPLADAGAPQTVTVGTLVTLTGVASSDPENQPLTFGWLQVSGAPVVLSDASAVSPTFTAPNTTGTLVFRLIVTDTANHASALAVVTVTVTNNAPVANAGTPQSVNAGATVTLTGVASSDADGHALTFGWTQVSGAGVTLDNASAVSPTFTAPITPGEIVFQLIVTDAFGLASVPSVMTVTVTNGEPTANAGTSQTVVVNAGVTLNGSASNDLDGHALTFGWMQTSGTPVALSNASDVSPTFTAPNSAGTLVFQLVVTDAFGLASTASVVTITVTNGAPAADAGQPQTVTVGMLVTLTGVASSDPENQALTFGWTQISGTPVTLDNTSAVSPVFTAPGTVGTLVFHLVVTDTSNQPSAPSVVTVTVTNRQPIANAGAPQTVYVNAGVTLNGSASSDPENQALTFGWSQVSGTLVALSDASATAPTFTAPSAPDVLVFQLVVTDSAGLVSAPALVTITVQSAPVIGIPPGDIVITLTTGIARLQPTSDFTATIITGTEPITFVWDFGDGSPLFYGPVASHVYAPGHYTATLTATNSAGTVTSTIHVFVPWRMLLAIIVRDSTLPMMLQR